jgi:hypothetical protein
MKPEILAGRVSDIVVRAHLEIMSVAQSRHLSKWRGAQLRQQPKKDIHHWAHAHLCYNPVGP